MLKRRLIRHLLRIVGVAVVGGLLSATLVRAAPGFELDERQLDSRLNADSLQALRAARGGDGNIARFYLQYLKGALHGDLGNSTMFHRPVRQLIRERLPVTLRLVGSGLLFGWTLAFFLATTSSLARLATYNILATLTVATLLSIPAAVLALALVFLRAPGYLGVALVVFPKAFSYARGLLQRNYTLPHIITAHAKGIGSIGILLRHVLPVGAPEFIAIAAVSVSSALGAAIPVEALCGIPGIGSLAWQAALSRDLPLLVNVTVIVTVITLVANSSSDLLSHTIGGHSV